MLRYQAMVKRVMKELVRDKRTLALMMVAPMLILTLMYFVFNNNQSQDLMIGINDSVPSKIVKQLPDKNVQIKSYHLTKNYINKMKTDDLDAMITYENKIIQVYYKNEDPTKTNQTKMMLKQAMIGEKMTWMKSTLNQMQENLSAMVKELPKPIAAKINAPKVEKPIQYELKNTYVYGSSDSTFFDKIFPVLIGFFVFFFVFLISGIALLRERTTGTLNRLISTPIKRNEIVFGYMTGFGVFAIIQTILVVLYAVFLLDLHIEGNILWVLVTNILLALVALSMGIFVSTFANSEFQMIQFIPIVVIPQVFFSGIIPIDTLAEWVKYLSKIFPLTYGGHALSAVMIRGEGLEHIWINLLVLVGFIVFFTVLNIIGLKRYRKV